ncbi:miniconductance mechanosensitive channel MscM [Neiella marina]|uniref:Miniconductance mechanosensitive channel MscM n=1 Tax=Neiella marina TaxID=508461 RepID=A0A8J2U353_9GAMM|nr:mechanosensitive ion channel domain-containing protein [Neiella marina]GGA69356.1 miniconductance mechanosensitive channel MscM [Neiella marina]
MVRLLVVCLVLMLSLVDCPVARAAVVTIDQLEQLIKRTPAANNTLIERYQGAIQLLTERQNYHQEAEQYRQLLQQYPQDIAEAKTRQTVDEDKVSLAYQQMDQLQISSVIKALEQQIALAREKLQALEDDGREVQQRMVDLPRELDDVVAELERSYATELTVTNDALLNEANQFRQDALREMLQAKQQVMQLESLGASKRIELNQLKIAKANQLLLDLMRQLRLANERLAELRQKDAALALAELDQAAKVVAADDQALQQIIARNIELTRELEELQSSQQTAQLRYQGLHELSVQINALLRELRKNIDRFEPSVEFSNAIVEQLAALSGLPNIQELSRTLNQLRVDSFSYRNEQRKNRQSFQLSQRDEERDLLDLQQQLLTELIGINGQLELLLKQALVNIDQLTHRRSELEEQAFRLLTWIPNMVPITAADIPFVLTDFRRIGSELVHQWRLYSLHAGESVFQLVLLLLLAVYLRRFQVQYNHYLDKISDRIGNVRRDKGHYSLTAIFGIIALGSLLPLGVQLADWLSQNSQIMIQQLILLTMIAVSLQIVANQLRKPSSVLIHHFRMKPAAIDLIMRHVIWLSPLFLAVLLIYSWLSDWNPLALFSATGRLLHLINAVLLTWATIWLFRLVSKLVAERGDVIRLPMRMLWWFGIAVPASATVLLLFGYIVAAQMLLQGYGWTLASAAVICVAYFLALRGIAILYRRLAFERALNRRAQALAKREENDDSNEPVIEEPQESYIEFDDIGAQASKLLRTTFVLAFYFSLLPIWSDAFDSLSALNDLTLWSVQSAGAQGQLETTSITIKVLLTAIVTGGFTLVSVRNIPGMLELLVLQRMQLSPGTGYAITTITKYVILIVGLLVVVGALGFDWSSLQWLVAALTVGLGFGLQEIFANFVSGLIILFEKPIRIGDTVTIRGMSGTVTRINTRATTVVDWDRKEIIIPNKAFITEDFVNWSLSDAITRIVLRIGVRHNSDVRMVTKMILQAADECDMVIDEPTPEVFLLEYSDSALIFELRAFTNETAHRLPSIHDIHSRVIKKFNALNIEVAHPQLDIHVKHAAGIATSNG